MVKEKAGNSKTMRHNNKASIMRRLFEDGEMSRVALAKALGLTSAAITLLVQELIEEGRVVESGKRQKHASGRKEVLLDLDYGALKAYGINAERDKVHFSIASPREVISEEIRPAAELINAVDKANYLADVIKSLPTCGAKPLGLGVCVSGLLGFDGRVTDTGGLFKQGYDIAEKLSLSTGFKVFSLNNVRAQARALIDGKNRDFMYIKHGPGLGAAIVSNGLLLSGADNRAGELGHTFYKEDAAENLESFITENNIVEAYAAKTGFEGSVKDLYAEYGKTGSAAEFLSIRITALVNSVINATALINPRAILVSGGVFENDRLYFTIAERVIARCGVRFERVDSRIKIKSMAGARLVFDQILFNYS